MPVQAPLKCSALQGVSPTALRRFRRRISGALMERAAAAASDAIPGGRFRRAGGSLVVRWWRVLQVRLQALSPAKGAVGLHWAPLQAL